MVIKKGVQKQKITRTSAGLLKHKSKKIGFVSTKKLTQESGNVIKRMAERKVGIREKKRLAKKKVLQKRQKVVEDEDYIEGTQAVFEQLQISPEDEKILQMFPNNQNAALKERLLEQFQQNLDQAEQKKYEENILSNPKVQVVYEDVAQVLSTYRSGKLPQPFHVIPTLQHWKQLLQFCRPEEWSAQAIFASTKIFSSSMDKEQAEYFYSQIILPAVRKSIKSDKKLNIHLYQTLIKALYKPQAWFKGILFPLCAAEDFTIKEAQIIGSVIHKMHIPLVHSAIAIFKIAQLEMSGPICVILKVLIEKKYSLPERALQEILHFFQRYGTDQREMPVIWHQMILRVCELYKLNDEQKKEIKSLVQQKSHHLITKEILKVLTQQKQRQMDLE